VILTTLYLVGAKNTNSWCARKGDLQCAFPLDVSMVPSSVVATTAGGEHLSCSGFYLGGTIHLGTIEFITDHFSALSLSPIRVISDAIIMGFASTGPPSPRWAVMGDSSEGSPMAPDGEGRIDHLSPRRHGMGAQPTPAMTVPRPKNPPIARATTTTPPWQATSRWDLSLPLEQRHDCLVAAQ
jgi:hypothetical protein